MFDVRYEWGNASCFFPSGRCFAAEIRIKQKVGKCPSAISFYIPIKLSKYYIGKRSNMGKIKIYIKCTLITHHCELYKVDGKR